MADITTINASEIVSDSRAVINTNFANLNAGVFTGLTIGANGILFATDGVGDIGAAEANRPLHIYATHDIEAGGIFVTGPGGAIYFRWRGWISTPADGYVALLNSAATSFNCLQLGGTTNAYPAVKRDGASIRIRVASDDADANLKALGYYISDVPGLNGSFVTPEGIFITITNGIITTYTNPRFSDTMNLMSDAVSANLA